MLSPKEILFDIECCFNIWTIIPYFTWYNYGYYKYGSVVGWKSLIQNQKVAMLYNPLGNRYKRSKQQFVTLSGKAGNKKFKIYGVRHVPFYQNYFYFFQNIIIFSKIFLFFSK